MGCMVVSDKLNNADCRVGDPDLGWSEEFNFTMPPVAHQVSLNSFSLFQCSCTHSAIDTSS